RHHVRTQCDWRRRVSLVALAVTALLFARSAQAQGTDDAAIATRITGVHQAAAEVTSEVFCHITPVTTGVTTPGTSPPDCQRHRTLPGPAGLSPESGSTAPPFFYPTDVAF